MSEVPVQDESQGGSEPNGEDAPSPASGDDTGGNAEEPGGNEVPVQDEPAPTDDPGESNNEG